MRLVLAILLFTSVSICAAQEDPKPQPHFRSIRGNELAGATDVNALAKLALEYTIAHHLLKGQMNHYDFIVGLPRTPDCVDCRNATVYLFNHHHWFPFRRHQCVLKLDVDLDTNAAKPIVEPVVYR